MSIVPRKIITSPRPPSPRPGSGISIFTSKTTEKKSEPTPKALLIEIIDFTAFLQNFMTPDAGSKYIGIVEKSRMAIEEACSGQSGLMGRAFNEFPDEFEKDGKKFHAVDPFKLNKWIALSYKLVVEETCATCKVFDIALPQKNGGIHRESERFYQVENEKHRAVIASMVDEMLGEAEQQLFENGRIKGVILAVLELQDKTRSLSQEALDMMTLQLTFSHVTQIIFANMFTRLRAEAMHHAAYKPSFEKIAANFLYYLTETLYVQSVVCDAEMNHHLSPHFTSYFQEKMLKRKIECSVKPRADFIVKGARELKIQVEDLVPRKEYIPRLSPKLFTSFFNNTYPLEAVPEKFKLENFAAVTRQDKVNLITLIVMDDFTSQPGLEVKSVQHLEKIKKVMGVAIADITEHQTSQDELKLETMQSLSLDFFALTDAITPTPKQGEAKVSPSCDMKEKLRRFDVLDVFAEHINKEYAPHAAKRSSIFQAASLSRFHPHTRQLSVQSIRDLPDKAGTAFEFVSILQAEHEAMKNQKCLFSTALSQAVVKLSHSFLNEVKEVSRDAKLFAEAVCLLSYVGNREKSSLISKPAKFEAIEKEFKTTEIQAARAIAHHLVKMSLKEFLKVEAEMEKLWKGIESVCASGKVSKTFVSLLGDVMSRLKPCVKCQKIT